MCLFPVIAAEVLVTPKSAGGDLHGQAAEWALPTFLSWMHGQFFFNHIDLKNARVREKSLWLSCFKAGV